MPKPRTVKKTAKAPKVQPLMLSAALKRFVLDNPHASADTKKAIQRAGELFLQTFGDALVSMPERFETSCFPFPGLTGEAQKHFHFRKRLREPENWLC
ncbi:hypothetical protein ZMO1_ZMOp32x033 (plasmid) [Zymomonas mobilis subsp. mobilis ZM4 = ATCC 31821]|nr:hypothetical protein ZMO1_ZMOp32x033 [Zymomonas mobilis subsp. mobilis ZM4 = ATCC 31821]